MTTPDRNAHDYDAIVIGAGHNGLVCAAYLAKAGMRTLLVEARSTSVAPPPARRSPAAR